MSEGGVPAQSLMPPALCTVLIHPSLASSNHRAAFLYAGPPSSMGPPHGHVKCQAHLHESTKRSNKTNMGVTREIRIRLCWFTQQHDECRGICAHETIHRWFQVCRAKTQHNGTQWKVFYGKTPSSYSSLLFEVRHMYIIMLVCKDQG